MGLAESAEARMMSCSGARVALQSGDDGTRKTARRHVKHCVACAAAA
jgi:hypothetical protein